MAIVFVLLSPAVILLVSITRLLIVCNYQTSTAIAVASTSGAVTTLAGTLVPLVPVFLPLVTYVVLLAGILYLLRGEGDFGFRLLIGATVACIATLFVAPTSKTFSDIGARGLGIVGDFGKWVLLAILVISIAIFVLGRMSGGEALSSAGCAVAAGVAVAVVAMLVSLPFIASYAFPNPGELGRIPEATRRVWLPAEQIQLKTGGLVTGYVLAAGDRWVSVLLETDRTVAHYRADDVASRTVCRLHDPDNLPLIRPRDARIPNIPTC